MRTGILYMDLAADGAGPSGQSSHAARPIGMMTDAASHGFGIGDLH